MYKKSGDDSDHIDTGFSFWDRRHSSVSYAVLLAQQETSALKTALETSHYAGINILAELKAIWFLAYPMVRDRHLNYQLPGDLTTVRP